MPPKNIVRFNEDNYTLEQALEASVFWNDYSYKCESTNNFNKSHMARLYSDIWIERFNKLKEGKMKLTSTSTSPYSDVKL